MPDDENNGQNQDESQNDDGQTNNDEGDDFDKERALRTIRMQRESEARLKTENADMLRRLQELENAGKSELEQLRAENSRLNETAQKYEREKLERITIADFEEVARKAGALRPSALYKLAADLIETNEDGSLKNSNEVIRKLKSEIPEMFGGTNGSADGGTRSNGAQETNMNTLIRRAAGRG